jgi:hypothetical protein
MTSASAGPSRRVGKKYLEYLMMAPKVLGFG